MFIVYYIASTILTEGNNVDDTDNDADQNQRYRDIDRGIVIPDEGMIMPFCVLIP